METPYYLIDERRLLRNLRIIDRVRRDSGAKAVLALKCFSTWGVFDLMRPYLDGTTSSSPFEARLGREAFGKEVHAYSVGYSRADIRAVAPIADKVIFNSASQLRMHRRQVRGKLLGLRANPGISYSHYDLANPARRYSRLGVPGLKELTGVASLISGLMFHFNCENDDLGRFADALDHIGRRYGRLLRDMDWVSLGGGLAFTAPGYPVGAFCDVLAAFARAHGVQVYLEPGEAAITRCAELVTTVLDVVHNEVDIAIVDASIEAHLLDHLIYGTHPRLASPGPGPVDCMIAGRSCLAGDVFGRYKVTSRLKPGRIVRFADAAGYTMVKKNWFNGVAMPAICVRRLDGRVETVRAFGYEDFAASLS